MVSTLAKERKIHQQNEVFYAEEQTQKAYHLNPPNVY